MIDPHGGPAPPSYDHTSRLAEDINRYVSGGAVKRYGVVEDVTPFTTHDTATVTIAGMRMAYVNSYSPSVGDRVMWLQMEDNRICVGEYGRENPRVKSWISNTFSLTPGTWDLYFDGNSTTDHQDYFDHSTSFFPYLFAPSKRGYYEVAGGIQFQAGDGSVRALGLKQNGTAIWSKISGDFNAIFPTTINFCIPINVNAGDTLSLYLIHNASGALNIDAGWATTFFAARFLQSWP